MADIAKLNKQTNKIMKIIILELSNLSTILNYNVFFSLVVSIENNILYFKQSFKKKKKIKIFFENVTSPSTATSPNTGSFK